MKKMIAGAAVAASLVGVAATAAQAKGDEPLSHILDDIAFRSGSGRRNH
ncbi:hypothetical protein AB0C96_15595 [Streptomyces sp. NPDC048506]